MIASSAIAAGAAALQNRMVVMERAGHTMTSRGGLCGAPQSPLPALGTGFDCSSNLPRFVGNAVNF